MYWWIKCHWFFSKHNGAFNNNSNLFIIPEVIKSKILIKFEFLIDLNVIPIFHHNSNTIKFLRYHKILIIKFSCKNIRSAWLFQIIWWKHHLHGNNSAIRKQCRSYQIFISKLNTFLKAALWVDQWQSN